MIRTALISAALLLAGALPAAAVVDIQRVQTPDGHTAWLVEDHSVPLVALEIGFRGGTSVDPEGARGAVNLMTGLLEEGAGDMDAQGFATARDDIAARIGFSSSDDRVGVSAEFLSETTDRAVELIDLALTEPTFSETAVERVRQQVLAGLRSDQGDPQAIAGREFAQQIYRDHPYATPSEGTIESVEGLSRDDLVAAHDAAIAADRAFFAAAGDITPERLGAIVDRIMADLPQAGAPLPDAAPTTFDGAVQVVDLATPQSVIRFAQPGIARDDPDFFAAYVLNQLFGGGGLGSRLMDEIREKRGLTYGVSSFLVDKDHADLMVGGAATGNATAGEAVELIRQEWQRMADDGPTEAELARAKTYLTGAYPLRFDGNGAIASILLAMQMDGLEPSYVDTRNDRIEAVTLEDARRVAGVLLQPDALTFTVVGQPQGM